MVHGVGDVFVVVRGVGVLVVVIDVIGGLSDLKTRIPRADGRTDGRTDGRMDGRLGGRTRPPVDTQSRINRYRNCGQEVPPHE